ncbi:MAG TPA: hypothetical protein VN851_12275 [Thermoanaerobaculia bacterium]|nr:hypothetical protein [Thermoanaerobaculia bacterium]
MSRRISVCVLSLILTGAVLVPSSSFAQDSPGARAVAGGANWLSALWEQVLDSLAPLSEAGILIDGNGLASHISDEAGILIDGNGTNSEAGILIDGNGRPAPRSDS